MTPKNTYRLCMIALCVAVISILAQFSIPLPFGVPLTLQNFGIILTAILLGKKDGTIAVCVYLILGLTGLPVFSNFRSGIHVLFSPTGGYLIGYPIMSYLIGYGSDQNKKKFFFLGYLLDYLLGLLMFCYLTSSTITTGLFICVIPFLPTDILKALLAYTTAHQIKKRLQSFL